MKPETSSFRPLRPPFSPRRQRVGVTGLAMVLGAASLLALGGCSSGGASPRPEIVQVKLRQAEIVDYGRTWPSVVFEAGGNEDGVHSWRQVFRRLPKDTRIFAWSRPGQGESVPIVVPRGARWYVDELHALLERRNVPKPYILVGEEMGATYLELFARLYPDEVAGVVMVRPVPKSLFDAGSASQASRASQPSQNAGGGEGEEAEAKVASRALKALRVLTAVSMWQDKENFVLTQKQLAEAPPFPDVPLLVLADRDAVSQVPKQFAEPIEKGFQDLAAQSNFGELRWLRGESPASQYQPGAIASAVEELRARIATPN